MEAEVGSGSIIAMRFKRRTIVMYRNRQKELPPYTLSKPIDLTALPMKELHIAGWQSPAEAAEVVISK